MLSPGELRLLHDLSRDHWCGRGLIVDAGCFLGGSTMALGHGIRSNSRWACAPVKPIIHSYDLFQIEQWTVGPYFPKTRSAGESFEGEYRSNIAAIRDLVEVHPGNVMTQRWDGKEIEILFVDLAKHWTVSDFVVRTFFPRLVPGHSVVLQQDYLYHEWNGWIIVTMELLSGYFQMFGKPESSTVMFRLAEPLPENAVRDDVFQRLGLAEIDELFRRAIARFGRPERAILERSRGQLMALLRKGHWKP